MTQRILKPADEIHALTIGEEFKDLALPTKQQLAGQLISAENELDLVFPSLLTQAKTPDQRRFLLALVTVPAPSETAQDSSTDSPKGKGKNPATPPKPKPSAAPVPATDEPTPAVQTNDAPHA